MRAVGEALCEAHGRNQRPEARQAQGGLSERCPQGCPRGFHNWLVPGPGVMRAAGKWPGVRGLGKQVCGLWLVGLPLKGVLAGEWVRISRNWPAREAQHLRCQSIRHRTGKHD